MGMNQTDERLIAAKREIRARSLDGVQRRTIETKVEVRQAGERKQIVGLGIVYNQVSGNLGGFREVIAPGAATAVLAASPDVRGLFNHNPDLILGRTLAGTMSLEETDDGVPYVIDPPDTSYARDLLVSLERGDVTQSSFAFRIARGGDHWEEDEETGGLLRTITEFSGLYDMSPVTYPAYEQTHAATSSTDAGERNGDAPSGGTRTEDGPATGSQAKGLSAEYVARDLAARARLLAADARP